MSRLRRFAITTGLALVLGSVLAVAFRPAVYAPYDEARDYVAIANRDYGDLYSYYAGRVLHPLVARLVASITRKAIDARVFIWVSTASLLGFFCCLGIYYATEAGVTGALWLLLLVTPTLVDSYRNYYWHDLFYAALCALFFLLLRAREWMALPILFLLYLTRESTLLLVVALVIGAALRRDWKFGLAAALVGVAGMKVDSALVARALPNHHGISTALLDLLKVPYNFTFNVCGLEFWTNTNAATTDRPSWVTSVPAWLHLGNIREVGYSGFSWTRPAGTLLILSTAFGLLPIVVAHAVGRDLKASNRASQVSWRGEDIIPRQQKNQGRRKLHGFPNFQQLLTFWGRPPLDKPEVAAAFVYGTLTFILTPLIGTTPSRYVLYAWPLFWLVGVDFLRTAISSTRERVHFVLLSLCAAWIPAFVRLFMGPSIRNSQSLSTTTKAGLVGTLALVGLAYVFGWHVLAAKSSNGG